MTTLYLVMCIQQQEKGELDMSGESATPTIKRSQESSAINDAKPNAEEAQNKEEEGERGRS